MSASLGAALAARAQARNPYGVNPNAEFQLGWEAALASVAMQPAPTVVVDIDGLWQQISLADERGTFLSIQDAGQRFWIIGGDEHGDHWATSFPEEDDAMTMPCIVANAPIVFPVAVFRSPDGNSSTSCCENCSAAKAAGFDPARPPSKGPAARPATPHQST